MGRQLQRSRHLGSIYPWVRVPRRSEILLGSDISLSSLTIRQRTLVHVVAQQELTALAFYMMALFSAAPTLHASWRTRPFNDED